MSTKPSTIAVATYANRDAAVEDYEVIRGAKHQGQLDHLAIAVLDKGADGRLKVDRHDSSAKHLAWGGAIVGAALAVIVPPVGIVTLASGATTTGVLAGAGGIIGHFHRNVPKETVEKMGALLESGDAGLILIVEDPKGLDVGALLTNAQQKVVTADVKDDKDATKDALEEAFDSIKAEEPATSGAAS